MTERLLQFIWQYQYFNKSELSVLSGESLQILYHGQYNKNQGPDFSNAKIKIGETIWVGNIELHIKTSDWDKHQHGDDKNYQNVILHVVWEDDKDQKNFIPVLQLRERVSKILLQRYEDLMNATTFIPCEKTITTIPGIIFGSWKERLLVSRLLRKSDLINTYLNQNNFHWEETLWWLLARNFGITVNADAFEAIARSIPVNILTRYKHQIHQLEALLFGQSRLLQRKFREDYPRMLKKEYQYQKSKYRLQPISVAIYFLRMRPGNFPTVRLAQLAMLVHESVHLFSRIKEIESISEIRSWMNVTANDYWHYHYRFDELSGFKQKKLGSGMIDNIIINTIVPVLFTYGNYHAEEKFKTKALNWLEATSSDNNSITRRFVKLGLNIKNAHDSQALLELKTQYCDHKKCLDCSIGNFLLHPQK